MCCGQGVFQQSSGRAHVSDLEDGQSISQQRTGTDTSRGAMRNKGLDLQNAVGFLWLDHRLVKDDQKRGQKSYSYGRDLVSLGLKCFTICLVGNGVGGCGQSIGWGIP